MHHFICLEIFYIFAHKVCFSCSILYSLVLLVLHSLQNLHDLKQCTVRKVGLSGCAGLGRPRERAPRLSLKCQFRALLVVESFQRAKNYFRISFAMSYCSRSHPAVWTERRSWPQRMFRFHLKRSTLRLSVCPPAQLWARNNVSIS